MNEKLQKVVTYMKAHWPSEVKPEWQVSLEEYPMFVAKAVQDFTAGATKKHHLYRVAGLSGSGKTSQILPAVESSCQKQAITPVLIAARRFVEYHPHYKEIKDFYGEANLRKMTDEFSTIMLFMTISALIQEGYDIILDVTLLDPSMEQILQTMLEANQYQVTIFMIATSPNVTEHFLSGRPWRHSRETELEFIRATKKSLNFYAENWPNLRIILWSVYDQPPIYDGEISKCLDIFNEYSARTDLPKKDDDARRAAKIKYLEENY